MSFSGYWCSWRGCWYDPMSYFIQGCPSYASIYIPSGDDDNAVMTFNKTSREWVLSTGEDRVMGEAEIDDLRAMIMLKYMVSAEGRDTFWVIRVPKKSLRERLERKSA